MNYNFDKFVERLETDSMKWRIYPKDVLPLWVADTDFEIEPKIIEAIQERLKHPVFGYAVVNPELVDTFKSRMDDRYNWSINRDAIVPVPGIVPGFNFALKAFVKPGESVLIQTPAYPPFFSSPAVNGLNLVTNNLVYNADTERYEIDFEDFEKRIKSENVRAFILCNPQNPTGRVFTPDELRRMGEICIANDVLIISDEIHAEILFSGQHHTPIASLSPEIAKRTVTFMAPSKTFNIPGLACSVAIIENPELRDAYGKILWSFSSGVSLLSQVGGMAAYKYGGEWLRQLNEYLEGNRDFLYDSIRREIPEVRQTKIEATFLAWLDFSNTKIADKPQQFFLENAKVALNDGKTFGSEYGSFVRLNFGTSRARLSQALDQIFSAYRRK